MKISDILFENIPEHHVVWIQFWKTGNYLNQAPDGMSMHISKVSLYEYKKHINTGFVVADTYPDVFVKLSGNPMKVAVTDDVYVQLINNNGLMRLLEAQVRNLIHTHKIITVF